MIHSPWISANMISRHKYIFNLLLYYSPNIHTFSVNSIGCLFVSTDTWSSLIRNRYKAIWWKSSSFSIDFIQVFTNSLQSFHSSQRSGKESLSISHPNILFMRCHHDNWLGTNEYEWVSGTAAHLNVSVLLENKLVDVRLHCSPEETLSTLPSWVLCRHQWAHLAPR